MQKMDRPKPIDHLQFDGPAPTVTTYSNMYPGHRGRNQYVSDIIYRSNLLIDIGGDNFHYLRSLCIVRSLVPRRRVRRSR